MRWWGRRVWGRGSVWRATGGDGRPSREEWLADLSRREEELEDGEGRKRRRRRRHLGWGLRRRLRAEAESPPMSPHRPSSTPPSEIRAKKRLLSRAAAYGLRGGPHSHASCQPSPPPTRHPLRPFPRPADRKPGPSQRPFLSGDLGGYALYARPRSAAKRVGANGCQGVGQAASGLSHSEGVCGGGDR